MNPILNKTSQSSQKTTRKSTRTCTAGIPIDLFISMPHKIWLHSSLFIAPKHKTKQSRFNLQLWKRFHVVMWNLRGLKKAEKSSDSKMRLFKSLALHYFMSGNMPATAGFCYHPKTRTTHYMSHQKIYPNSCLLRNNTICQVLSWCKGIIINNLNTF